MARDFLPNNPDQQYLLPPDMREWVPEDHLIWFLSDVVDSLDLSAIFQTYQKDELRGRAGYHPAMMVKLILSRLLPGQDLLSQDRAGHL